MVRDTIYSGLADYLKDIGNIPFALGPVNGNKTGFAFEREKRNYEFGVVIQRYLSTEKRLLEKIKGLEEKTESEASLNISKGHAHGELVRNYKKKLKSARDKLECHRQDNGPAYVQAKHGLTESCLCLVVSIAKRYAKSGISLIDLIGYGNKGLMRAVEKFDPEKGFQLSTYATWWIRQSILRGISHEQINGNLSSSFPAYRKLRKILKIEGLLFSELGREPREEEVARKYNEVYGLKNPDSKGTKDRVDAGIVKALIKTGPVLRLSLFGYDENNYLDVEGRDEPPHQIADRNDEYKRVFDYLSNSNTFTSDEQEVIKHRFGLEDEVPKTLDETGKILGLTKERIRQIGEKALNKLKLHFDSQYREEYLRREAEKYAAAKESND